MQIKPRNWGDFQQYKDRKPQWIKLHRDLLNDFAYSSVRIGTKATLPLLWLLSCESEDGTINASVEEIAFRIHIDKSTVQSAIEELLEIGMYESVQSCTEPYLEKRREEKRKSVYTSSVFNDESINKIVDYRKSIKAPLKTQQGYVGLENKISSVMSKFGLSLDSVLEIMAKKEWKSVDVEWVKREGYKTGSKKIKPASELKVIA